MQIIVMNQLIHISTFLLIGFVSIAQYPKHDYHWFTGKNQSTSTDSFLALEINFNEFPAVPKTRNSGLQFGRNNASMADAQGNLLFYTNGCAVADTDHEIMMNGDSINSGAFFDTFWQGNCRNGYPGKQDVIILDDPGVENGYYLIHKTIEYFADQDPDAYIRYLKYTYVDLSLNNGKGAVVEKNIPFYDAQENQILSSYLSAIKHDNQVDWWIIQPQWNDDKYITILLTENGFEKIDTQDIIRPHDDFYSSASGNSRFSPDGESFTYYNVYDGLHVYDFDRSTGLLSDPRSYYPAVPATVRFSSIEYSPNSELLYFMTRDSLWQADLSYDNLENGVEFIAEWNGIPDPADVTFFDAALAPDCRIYIRGGSSALSAHVINKPNEKGIACDLVQNGIQFPIFNSVSTWPHSPRWRVDEEEKCDPSIVSMFGELVYYRRDLEVYPVPTAGPITIRLPDGETRGTLAIINNDGQLVETEEIDYILSEYRLDLSHYPSGIYNVEYLPKYNKERRIYTARVVVE